MMMKHFNIFFIIQLSVSKRLWSTELIFLKNFIISFL